MSPTGRCVSAFVLILVILAAGNAARACPTCDTDTGRQVQAGIVDEHLSENVLAVTLPFAVLGTAVAVLHFGVPLIDRKDRP